MFPHYTSCHIVHKQLNFVWCCHWQLLQLLLLCSAAAAAAAAAPPQTFVRQPSDKYVHLGNNALLPCQVANKVGDVQWTRDEFGLGVLRELTSFARYQMIGDDAEGTYSLQIRGVTLEDDAVFQCQVGASTDQHGIRSRNAHLTVLVAPEPPRIRRLHESAGDSDAEVLEVIEVNDGESVILECESRGGKPSVEINWMTDTNEVINNGTSVDVQYMPDHKRTITVAHLTYKVAYTMHNRLLKCRVHNAALEEPQTTTLRLSVRYKPRLHITADQSQLRELDDVTLTCHSSANPQTNEYSWSISGEAVPNETGPSLLLHRLDRTWHGKEVGCQSSNQIGSSSAKLRLNILYGPIFADTPTELTGILGQSVNLSCQVDSNPPVRISWYRVDCPFCPKLVGAGSPLTIHLSDDTVGLYECHLTTTTSSTSTSTSTSNSSDIHSQSRGDASWPNIGDQRSAEAQSGVAVEGFDHHYQQQQQEQQGVGAGFGAGSTMSRLVRLRLMTAPLVRAELKQYAAPLGDTTYVQCLVTGVPAANNVTWYHAGRPVNTDSGEFGVVSEPDKSGGGVRYLLVIGSTRQHHLGTYNCTFANALGVGSALVVLNQPKSSIALVTLSAVLAGVLFCVVLLICVQLYQCRKRRTKLTKSQTTNAGGCQKPIVSVEPRDSRDPSGGQNTLVSHLVTTTTTASSSSSSTSGADMKTNIRSHSPIADWNHLSCGVGCGGGGGCGGCEQWNGGGRCGVGPAISSPPLRAGLLAADCGDYYNQYTQAPPSLLPPTAIRHHQHQQQQHRHHQHQQQHSTPSPLHYTSDSPSTYETIHAIDSPHFDVTGAMSMPMPMSRAWYDNDSYLGVTTPRPGTSAVTTAAAAAGGGGGALRAAGAMYGQAHLAILDGSRVVPAIASVARVVAGDDDVEDNHVEQDGEEAVGGDTTDCRWACHERGHTAPSITRLVRGDVAVTTAGGGASSAIATLSRLKPGTLATHV